MLGRAVGKSAEINRQAQTFCATVPVHKTLRESLKGYDVLYRLGSLTVHATKDAFGNYQSLFILEVEMKRSYWNKWKKCNDKSAFVSGDNFTEFLKVFGSIINKLDSASIRICKMCQSSELVSDNGSEMCEVCSEKCKPETPLVEKGVVKGLCEIRRD